MAFSTKFSLPSFLKQVNKMTESQRISIKRAGFGYLLHIPHHVLRRSQLLELMDTWSIEKQVFVFPIGEITITLLDVALILGLRVIGDPVVLEENAELTILEKKIGASVSNRQISVESLKEKLEDIGERDDQSFVKVFLLYCFGTLLFPSANGKVDSRYLSLLEDLNKVSDFAWGAAVVEDLHNSLSERKSKNTNNIGGCLILLQIWCYEHIISGRPKLLDGPSSFPRVCRWESSTKNYSTSSNSTIKFEELEHTQILWTLRPTSEEIQIKIVRDIPQVSFLSHQHTGPGTIQQPIDVGSERVTKMVQGQPEELILQETSTIIVVDDDEESMVIENLKKEILELRVIIDEERKEKDVMKTVQDENEQLTKRVQEEKDLRERVQGENEELCKRAHREDELREKIQYENEELRKRVHDEEELRERLKQEEELRVRVQGENEELGKRFKDQETLRKSVQYENEELRKRVQCQKDLRERVQGENDELCKRAHHEDELRERIQYENEELRKRVHDEEELRETLKQEEELRVRVQGENEEFGKRFKDEEKLKKSVQYENEELRKRVQCEKDLRERVQGENEELCKRVHREKELRERIQYENEELRKRVHDEEELRERVKQEEELRNRVQGENEELGKRFKDEEKLRKGVQYENEELRKRVQDEEELRERLQSENEQLQKIVKDEEESRKRADYEIEQLKKRLHDEQIENEERRGRSLKNNEIFLDLDRILYDDDIDLQETNL